MMTILENSRSDLESEAFFASPPKSKKDRSLRSRLQEMKKYHTIRKDITMFSSPMKLPKSPQTSQSHGSMIFVNSSNLVLKDRNISTKSLSMSIDFNLEESHFDMLMQEDEFLEKKSSGLDDSFLNSDDDKESPMLQIPSMPEKKLTTSLAERDIANHIVNLTQKQAFYDSSVILKKKLVYFDEEGYFCS